MKIIQFHRWDSMEPPYRKALTVCLFGWCRTIYYAHGIYAGYIGKGYHRRMSLGELKKIFHNQKGGKWNEAFQKLLSKAVLVSEAEKVEANPNESLPNENGRR